MQGSTRIDELRQKFHENPRRYFAPLANEYRKGGDPEQAIAICRAHLAQQPGHMSGHVVYGQALYDAGRAQEARAAFEKAISLDPDNAVVLKYLGDISRQNGENSESRHWYSRALDANPHDTEAAAYLAELTEPETEPTADLVTELATDPTTEPAIALTSETVVEPATEPAAADSSIAHDTSEDPPADDADVPWRKTPPNELSPFLTRTMAELYARQGYSSSALEVYRQLALQHPGDQDIIDRIGELERGDAESESSIPADPAASDEAPTSTAANLSGDADSLLPPADEEALPPIESGSSFPETEPIISEDPLEATGDNTLGFGDMSGELIGAELTADEDLSLDPITPAAGTPHFSDTELNSADAWDADSWGAGLSGDSDAEISFDDLDEDAPPAEAGAVEVEVDVEPQEDDTPVETAIPPEDEVPVEVSVSAENETPSADTTPSVDVTPLADVTPSVDTTQSADTTSSADTAQTDVADAPENAPLPGVVGEVAESVSGDMTVADPFPVELEFEPEEEVVAESAPTEDFDDADTDDADTDDADTYDDYADDVDRGGEDGSHLVAYSPMPPEDVELPHFVPDSPTVREFFATLRTRKPPAREPARSFTARAAVPESPVTVAGVAESYPLAGDAFAGMFPDAEVNEEDSRAAFALSGALASAITPSPPPAPPSPALEEFRKTPPKPTSAEKSAAKPAEPPGSADVAPESEEDLQRFREWLEGLAKS